jgi:hypothetical protein
VMDGKGWNAAHSLEEGFRDKEWMSLGSVTTGV